MKKTIILIFCLICFLSLNSQQLRKPTADLHNHITNKQFMNTVLNADSVEYYIKKDGKLPTWYLTNWTQKTQQDIDKDEDSHYSNYFQSTYTDLQKGNVSIAIQAISPVELNMFYDPNKYFRSFARKAGYQKSHIPKDVFDNFVETPSWTEAYNEMLFMLNQDSISSDRTHKILFPKNSYELTQHINDNNTTLGILSFEGGHILFGKNVLDSLSFIKPYLDSASKNEVRENIDYLRNKCDYRTFFITPIHIYWNTFGGQAKALDKLQERHKLGLISNFEWFRKKLFTKYGSGIPPRQNFNGTRTPPDNNCNCPENLFRVDNTCYETTPTNDDFGIEVISSFLNPNNKWKKPIYIDVKHMDVRSRIDYYLLRDSLQKIWNINIPIIYSHGAVSGEKLKVAYYTSVSPLPDLYEEIENPEKFYKKYFFDDYNQPIIKNCGLVEDYIKSNSNLKIFNWNDNLKTLITKQDLKLTNSLSDKSTVGWFYPWSINLFDEEIEEIYNSDGIIGVMAEERTLGWYLPNYQNDSYVNWLTDTLVNIGFLSNPDSTASLDSFRVAETFLRNVFYIVMHSNRNDISSWEHIGFGSDFDGFINPIDICQTSDDIPKFREYLCKVMRPFLLIHKEYHLADNPYGLMFNKSAEKLIDMLFYENSRKFILKYF